MGFYYFRNFFFIFLFLPAYSMYAMKREYDDTKNIALEEAVLTASRNKYSQEEDWKKIRVCIENGADVNYKIGPNKETILMKVVRNSREDLLEYLIQKGALVDDSNMRGYMPLSMALSNLQKRQFNKNIFEALLKNGANPNRQVLATQYGTSLRACSLLSLAIDFKCLDAVKLLLEYKADVNKEDFLGDKPLKIAISREEPQIIENLCGAGALVFDLTTKSFNAFSQVLGKPKECIEALMVSARFDFYEEIVNAEEDKQIKDIVIETVAILRNLSIPLDLQFHILSKLSPSHFHNTNNGLCKKLLEKGYKNPYIFTQVNKRAKYIGKLLENIKKYKDFLYMCSAYQGRNNQYIQEIQSLYNGKKIQKDYSSFNIEFPSILKSDPKNLICQMYINCAKLAESTVSNIK